MKNKIKGIVDRIENGQAVIMAEGDDPVYLTLPVSVLPPETEAGSIITLKIETQKNKTLEAKNEVSKLIQGLKKMRHNA
jgi:antitoxin (DNA-binding transcriptional repressor) of toxin-antitoxin stability system